jgi:predicted nucleic acid-binding protein
VIVLDAAVLIAYFDADAAHHLAAEALLIDSADDRLGMSPINEAEVLARSASVGLVERQLKDIRALSVEPVPLPEDGSMRLANLRARTRLKMPDCCVLLAAEQTGGSIASFDARLREAASGLGIAVVPEP